jgi:hypothetical protein
MNGITSGQTPVAEGKKLALPPVDTVEQVKGYAGERVAYTCEFQAPVAMYDPEAKLTLDGYTDERGTDNYNQSLSELRAQPR